MREKIAGKMEAKMKPHYLFLLLLFFLASCAPSTPALTATPVPTATSTLTSIPTATQTVTSTPEAWVTISEEYAMPEEMARQLDGMDVSFEEDVSPYVEGMLVVDNETGEDLFYYDAEQTGMWVAVDRFVGTTDIFNITSTITEEELYSEELTAWLYYKASKLEFDLDKINNAPMREFSTRGTSGVIFTIGFMPKSFVSEDSVFFERNPDSLMMIKTPDTDILSDHVFTPIILLGTDEQGKVKLYPIKAFLRGNFDKPAAFEDWESMSSFKIVIDMSEEMTQYNSPLESKISHDVFKQFMEGDFNALSDPKIVVETVSRPGW